MDSFAGRWTGVFYAQQKILVVLPRLNKNNEIGTTWEEWWIGSTTRIAVKSATLSLLLHNLHITATTLTLSIWLHLSFSF